MIDFNKKLLIVGTNVIESEEHVLKMAKEIKSIYDTIEHKMTLDIMQGFQLIFKVSFDKANRSSVESYRGVSINFALPIFRRIKEETGLPILTDVHEPYQVNIIKDYVDIIQIPAFLARQTDLLEAVAKSGLPVHIKKGQFMNTDTMLAAYNKIRHFGNDKHVILCERGTMFGYNDLIVDTRNIKKMLNFDVEKKLVSFDITHCLQQPGIKNPDGTVSSGGLRNFIPLMAKIGIAADVDCLFMEVHDDPENAKCDGPTQIKLDNLMQFLSFIIGYWAMHVEFYKYLELSAFEGICEEIENID